MTRSCWSITTMTSYLFCHFFFKWSRKSNEMSSISDSPIAMICAISVCFRLDLFCATGHCPPCGRATCCTVVHCPSAIRFSSLELWPCVFGPLYWHLLSCYSLFSIRPFQLVLKRTTCVHRVSVLVKSNLSALWLAILIRPYSNLPCSSFARFDYLFGHLAVFSELSTIGGVRLWYAWWDYWNRHMKLLPHISWVRNCVDFRRPAMLFEMSICLLHYLPCRYCVN